MGTPVEGLGDDQGGQEGGAMMEEEIKVDGVRRRVRFAFVLAWQGQRESVYVFNVSTRHSNTPPPPAGQHWVQ